MIKCKNFLCIDYDDNEYGNCIHDRDWGWEMSSCDQRKSFNRIAKAMSRMKKIMGYIEPVQSWQEEKDKAKEE